MLMSRLLAIGLLGVLCLLASALTLTAQEPNNRAPEAALIRPEEAPKVSPIRPGQRADAPTLEHCHRVASKGGRCAPANEYERCLQAFGHPSDAPVRFSRCITF